MSKEVVDALWSPMLKYSKFPKGHASEVILIMIVLLDFKLRYHFMMVFGKLSYMMMLKHAYFQM
jgi:hypothetical protein